MLSWLVEVSCPWSLYDVMQAVIVGYAPGSLKVTALRWLWSRKTDLSAAQKTQLLMNTAAMDGLECVQWLRDTVGAPWPAGFWGLDSSAAEVALTGTPVRGTLICWSLNTFKWARANGAPWGVWRCQMLDEAWYKEGWRARNAAAVFAWAHENDCPCTCENSDS